MLVVRDGEKGLKPPQKVVFLAFHGLRINTSATVVGHR